VVQKKELNGRGQPFGRHKKSHGKKKWSIAERKHGLIEKEMKRKQGGVIEEHTESDAEFKGSLPGTRRIWRGRKNTW